MAIHDELGYREPVGHAGHEAVLNIVLTTNMINKEADRLLRPHGLTESQFNVLMLLKYQAENGGGLNQTQLGRMLLVNRSNVTGLVDRMEQNGWVERLATTGDRRVNQVRITQEGRALLDKVEPLYYPSIDEAMGGLSEDERLELTRMLELIRSRLRVRLNRESAA